MTQDVTANTPALAPRSFWRRSRNFFLVSALVIGSGLAGAYITQSVNAQGFGPGFGHHGGFGPGGFGPGPFGRMDPAQIESRADRMVRHLAVEVDASTDQQEKLRTIVKAAVKDLAPMRDKAQTARERARTLLTQPNLSRTDIESFRTEQMALADQFSKRVSQALGEAAEVLTPAQRQKIADHMAERRGWRAWHRG